MVVVAEFSRCHIHMFWWDLVEVAGLGHGWFSAEPRAWVDEEQFDFCVEVK